MARVMKESYGGYKEVIHEGTHEECIQYIILIGAGHGIYLDENEFKWIVYLDD